MLLKFVTCLRIPLFLNNIFIHFCGGWKDGSEGGGESLCLESKRFRHSQNFNFNTYRNLIISHLIVTTMTTFSTYLLQLMTNHDSLTFQTFKTTHLAFTCSKSSVEKPAQCVKYVQS